MKKRITAFLLAVFLILPTVLLSACEGEKQNDYAYKAWEYKGEVNMSTGKLKENYDVPNGGKSASGIYTDYAPDLLYSDAYIDGVNASAVFHDQSEVYLSGGKTAAEAVTLYLRTAKGDISSASVVIKGYGAKFSETSEVQMTLSRSDDRFDYYSAVLTASAENRYYAFSLEKDGKTLYYTTYGLTASDPGNTAYNYFILTPGFETPAWSQGTVYYSIFPDSFFNGDALNDAGKSSYSGATARPWGTARTGYLYPNVARATGLDYYGGDLAGIYSKIGYLKNTLGVETVYTNPIFDATFNVGYGPDDFLTVSKYYGTNRELSALISALHENGMRFITDGVWLYSTANSKQYNKSGYWPENGAYQSENTPFKDFYYLEKGKTWPNVKTVYSESVFKINFESDYTKNIIFRNKDSALLYFLAAPYNMDGWRLDVPAYNASSTNGYEIMSGFREYMKKINPESVLIGETTVLPEERQGTALDSVWNYEDFAGPVYGFFGAPRNKPGDESTGKPVYKSFTASELLTKLYQSAAKVPYAVAKSEFNLLASHDTARVLTNLGSVEKAEIAAAVQFTYIGSPSLYYGDEIGLEGHSACFGDMGSFPWDESKWNYELLGTYRTLIKLRSDHENVMRHGGFMPLTADDASSVFAYARYNADDAVILAVNGGNERKTVEIPVYKLGLDEPVYNLYNYVTGEIYPVKDGKINVRLDQESFAAIVKDKSRGEYDGKYLSLDIGTPDATGAALKDGEKITLYSAGTLFDGVDNFRIFGEKAFGAFTVSADVYYENSGVMIRESDSPSSPFVAVIFKDKKKAVLCVREYEGGPVKEVASTEFPILEDPISSHAGGIHVTFIIERGADNSFTAYIIDENGKREIGKTYAALKNGVYAGVFGALIWKKPNGPLPLVFKNFSVEPSVTPLCDDFKSPVPAAVYAVLPDVLARTVGENGLELHPVSGLVRQMAALPEGDVSITVLTAKSEADAGAVLYQDERNYVKLTRSPSGELTFTAVLSGLETVKNAVSVSSDDVYLHLQRIGFYVNAYYSEDGKNYTVAGGIYWNPSELYGGMIAEGEGFGLFRSFTVGRQDENARQFAVDRDTSAYALAAYVAGGSNVRYGEGDWSYTDAGYKQTSRSGYAECDVISYDTGVRAVYDATLRITGGSGSAGLSLFKRSQADRATEAGCYLAVGADGSAILYKDGEKAAEASGKVDPSEDVRVRAIYEDGALSVWLNDASGPAIKCDVPVKNITASMGLVTDGASAEFRNVSTRVYARGESYSPRGYTVEKSLVKASLSDYETLLGPDGRAFSDQTAKLKIMVSSMENGGYVGLLLKGRTLEYPEFAGVLVAFDGKETVISHKGEVIARADCAFGMGKMITVEVETRGDVFTVRAGGEVIVSCEIPDAPPVGATQFIANYSLATIYDFAVIPE